VPDVVRGDWTARSGFEAGKALARDHQVTAVFVANDNMALGLLLALSEHRRRVPEEVSVVGFDDMDESAYFMPPLTTVHQDFDEVGRRSLELLLERLDRGESAADNGRRGARVVIAPRLVVRQSTARATTRAGRVTRRRRAPAGERPARNRTDERR